MNMNNMFGNKLMNRFFRKVDNVVWDLMTGKIGLVTEEGICTIVKEGDEYTISINPMEDFGVAIPSFAQNTNVDDVKEGDIVYNDKKVLGWIVEKKETSFRIMKADGTTTSWKPPKVQMFGLESGVLILRSLINTLPDGEKGLEGMKNMMLPMLMMGGEMDMDKMLPMMLMTGGMGGGNNMMQTMMMMNMMKGNGGNAKGMFGGNNFFDGVR